MVKKQLCRRYWLEKQQAAVSGCEGVIDLRLFMVLHEKDKKEQQSFSLSQVKLKSDLYKIISVHRFLSPVLGI